MSTNMKGVSAGKMKRMMSKKSHSWWWDSHISPKNSRWLAENLQEMDVCVKEMLKLIEEEGDSFAKKAEMYYQRRPELVAHVEDFYRMYRALAERYDNVTGELRKNLSETKSLRTESGSGSDFGSEPPTPEPKPKPPKSSHRAVGFDVFLGSGGISDVSKKGSDNSTSTSSSDSDSDSDSNEGDEVSPDLHQRILELENELRVANEKLEHHEKSEDLSEKIFLLENDLFAANEKLLVSNAEIASLQQKLNEHDKCEELAKNCSEMSLKVSVLENEILIANKKLMSSDTEVSNLQQKLSSSEAIICELTTQIAGLESDIGNLQKELLEKNLSSEALTEEFKARVADLEDEVNGYKSEIEELKSAVSKSNETVHQYETRLADTSDNFSLEKTNFEIKITELQKLINGLKEEIETLAKEKLQIESNLSERQQLVEKLEVEKLEACKERDDHIAELNTSLNNLNERFSVLLSDKEGLSEKISILTNNMTIRDDSLHKMNEHLHQLHLEHVKLMKKIEKLEEREEELEAEVERQKVVILDGAEGKREAIRQLCSTLEHYRDRYQHLRQIISKSPRAFMAVTKSQHAIMAA